MPDDAQLTARVQQELSQAGKSTKLASPIAGRRMLEVARWWEKQIIAQCAAICAQVARERDQAPLAAGGGDEALECQRRIMALTQPGQEPMRSDDELNDVSRLAFNDATSSRTVMARCAAADRALYNLGHSDGRAQGERDGYERGVREAAAAALETAEQFFYGGQLRKSEAARFVADTIVARCVQTADVDGALLQRKDGESADG